MRRTTTREEIDTLPVADRNFANLAQLAPGVLESNTNPGISTGIVAAGQTGRNNTFMRDGLTLDWVDDGNSRGSVPLDAIAEFGVQTNGFAVEFRARPGSRRTGYGAHSPGGCLVTMSWHAGTDLKKR